MTTTTVPSDIWEEIFIHCNGLERFIQPSATTAPLLLRQVCRSWRDIADSAPRLWYSLSIKVARGGCIPRTDLVLAWLTRARKHPLDLSLTLDTRPGPRAFENTKLALLSIAQFFTTWRRIVIQTGPFLGLGRFLEIIPATTSPHFESFQWIFPDSYEQAASHLEIILNRAPRLRDLDLGSEITANHIVDLKVPFNNLTSLTLSNAVFTIENCCQALEQCTNIVSFRVFNLRGQFETQAFVNKTPAVIHNLQTLEISSTSREMHHFFDMFTFPSLLSASCDLQYPFPCDNFLALLQRSSCSLISIRLIAEITEDDLLRCLERCPGLETLVLGSSTDEPIITDRVLESLNIRDSNSLLCPLIKNISFEEGAVSSGTTDGKLVTMVCTRFFSTNTPLEKFSVSFPRFRLQAVNVALLQLLKKRGLTVSLKVDRYDE